MNAWGELLVAVVMAVGMIGLFVPAMPGLWLVWGAGLAWAWLDGGGGTRWAALAAMTVFIIERQFVWAGSCTTMAAGLSWIGLIHSYRWMPSDTILDPGWGHGATWAIGYGLLTLLLLWAAWWSPTSSQSTDKPNNS